MTQLLKQRTANKLTWAHDGVIYPLLALVSVLYVLLMYKDALLFKSHSNGSLKLFLLNITIALPEIAIWTIAMRSAVRFKQYANLIKDSKDGESMTYLADALLLMVIYVIFLTMSPTLIGLFKNSRHLHTAIDIGNYLPLAVAAASSYGLYLGAQVLNQVVPLRLSMLKRILLVIAFILVAGLFAWHFYKIEPKLVPQNGIPRFITPVKETMLIYVLPLICLWGAGLLACLSIGNYAAHTEGAIYKALFRNLCNGIELVFVCTFLAQLFIASNFNLNKFSLALVLVYCLLILATLGFVLIYRGSSSLNRLEVV